MFLRLLPNIMYEAPLVVVLGATGAGKSKLALDIASRLNGEIVSADSMQVYRGLDIITNKVTSEEQALCKHHLIGFLSPMEEYSITDFQKQASQAIKDIQSRKKLPVLCGGTNYYIESVLWEFLMSTKDQDRDISPDMKELESIDASALHRRLEDIDPERAAKLHPNDKRKVLRSIEVFKQSGQKHSELLKMQTGERLIGGSLLFKNACLILVNCEKEVLEQRIDKRVDKMIEQGLLNELETFHKEYNRERIEKGETVDYEHGIFQSIGFKEFHEYLTKEIMTENERNKMLQSSIERMKLSTKQYARYQNKWIRKRIINRQGGLPVYAVDSTDPSLWDNKALNPSLKLLKTSISWSDWVDGVNQQSAIFSSSEVTNAETIKPIEQTEQKVDLSPRIKKECSICGGKIFLTEKEWDIHVSSKRHKKAEGSRKRKLNTTLNLLSKHERTLKVNESTVIESEKTLVES